jgi:hypothetical protein
MAIIQTKFGRFSQISEMKYKTLTTFFWGPVNCGIMATPKKKTITYTKAYFGAKKRPKVAIYIYD